MVRIFVREPVISNQRLVVDHDIKKWLVRVMRLEPGDAVEVVTPGRRWKCRLETVAANSAVEDKVKLTQGTQPGAVLTLRGKGVPYVNSYGRGDLYVQINVNIPSNLSSQEKKLLKEIARIRNEKIDPQERGVFDKVKDLLE